MNKIEFIRGQGGVVKALPGEDHISGFMTYMPDASLPTAAQGTDGFSTTRRIIAVSTIERAELLGITATNTAWQIKVLHYHLSEIFRINPSIVLYLGIFATPASAYDFAEVKQMQNFAEGKLRQLAVYVPEQKLAADDLTTLQGVADILEAQDAPLSLLYSCKIENISALTKMGGSGKKNVSVVIGQAGCGVGAELYTSAENTGKKSVTCIGVVLGIVSKAAVHESIGWVQKFPTGIDLAAFADGTLLRDLDRAVIDELDAKRFLFLITYNGLSGTYMNDSHTMDEAQSDYAYLEAVRTMDKAVRGIRTYILPYLGGSLSIDAETGKISPDTVTFLEQLAGKQLEDMEKAGELSGYLVKIDPNQNVLTTSTVEFIILKVQVGVMRKVKVKIGFTTKLK
ncbi:MAG: DUF2586 family protein [Odoribacter sp.]